MLIVNSNSNTIEDNDCSYNYDYGIRIEDSVDNVLNRNVEVGNLQPQNIRAGIITIVVIVLAIAGVVILFIKFKKQEVKI